MGFIKDTIKNNTSSLQASIGAECNNCNKAVAGMESNDKPQMSSREEGHADQAVTKEVGDQQYVLMDSAVGNLFTKALEVKFANGENNQELHTPRPVVANESAAMDTMHQKQALNDMIFAVRAPASVDQKISNLRIMRTMRFTPNASQTLLATRALQELQSRAHDLNEWVFVYNEAGATCTHPLTDAIISKQKLSPGHVPGLKPNEYHSGPVLSTPALEDDDNEIEHEINLNDLSGKRIKGFKIIVELED